MSGASLRGRDDDASAIQADARPVIGGLHPHFGAWPHLETRTICEGDDASVLRRHDLATIHAGANSDRVLSHGALYGAVDNFQRGLRGSPSTEKLAVTDACAQEKNRSDRGGMRSSIRITC